MQRTRGRKRTECSRLNLFNSKKRLKYTQTLSYYKHEDGGGETCTDVPVQMTSVCRVDPNTAEGSSECIRSAGM